MVKTSLLDNTQDQKVGEWLKDHIQPHDHLSVVSGYFSIYGYGVLKEKLSTSQIRFLFGDPNNVGNVDPMPDQDKAFSIDKNSELSLQTSNPRQTDNPLTQKWLAAECQKWVERESTKMRQRIESVIGSPPVFWEKTLFVR